MSPSVLAVVAGLAVLAHAGPARRQRAPRATPPPTTHDHVRRRRLHAGGAAALAAGASVLLLGGGGGLVAGALIAPLMFLVLGRLEPRRLARDRDALERQAPLVIDLVASCLASGAPLERALDASAAAVGAPAGDILCRATSALRLGADPHAVWTDLGRHAALAPMARAVARSQQTGAPLATLLPRVAEQARSARRARAEARIRTAGVRLTAPLGVAFLPAFVLLGVVPVVASWVGRLV